MKRFSSECLGYCHVPSSQTKLHQQTPLKAVKPLGRKRSRKSDWTWCGLSQQGVSGRCGEARSAGRPTRSHDASEDKQRHRAEVHRSEKERERAREKN